MAKVARPRQEGELYDEKAPPASSATSSSSSATRTFGLAFEASISAYAIAARLRTAIDLGFFNDGDLLPKEAALAAELRVSIFSLREALAQLRTEGLVITKAGRGGGTVVRRASIVIAESALRRLHDLSSVSLRDLSDWRTMVLAESARLAALRASTASVERLTEYAARIGRAETQIKATRAHARFDIELALASQSVRLTSAELQVYEESGWLLALAHLEVGYRQEASRSLLEMVEVIKAQDPNRAVTLAHSHTCGTFDRLIRLRLTLLTERGRKRP